MFSQRRSLYRSQQGRMHSTDLLHRCITPQLSLLLFRFVAFHHDMKFITAFFFFKGISAKQQKKPKKKKSLQHYRAKRIKRQLYGKYYKMFASKNDRSKWPARREFHWTSPRSGWTLSIDWPLFWALFCIEWFQFLFLMVWQWQQRTILKLWIYENHIIFMWTAEWRILLHVFEGRSLQLYMQVIL